LSCIKGKHEIKRTTSPSASPDAACSRHRLCRVLAETGLIEVYRGLPRDSSANPKGSWMAVQFPTFSVERSGEFEDEDENEEEGKHYTFNIE
jgi:hypothetical protein